MKTLLILAALGAGIWFLLARAKENAAVRQMADAPLRYTKALQNDADRAKAAAAAAQKEIDARSAQIQKAVEAQ